MCIAGYSPKFSNLMSGFNRGLDFDRNCFNDDYIKCDFSLSFDQYVNQHVSYYCHQMQCEKCYMVIFTCWHHLTESFFCTVPRYMAQLNRKMQKQHINDSLCGLAA